MKREITYTEKYDPAMKITDQAEADAYLEECVSHAMLHLAERGEVPPDRRREQAEVIERGNLGYWAGYYGDDVRERVERLFRCAHPIFGKIAEKGPPTAREAYLSGAVMATQGGAAILAAADALAGGEREAPRSHEPWCEGDGAHPGDCKSATRLARLTAFAESVRDEFECTDHDDVDREAHVDDCWHCYAQQALEKP